MRILFTFENPLPSAEADAEVFITTAKYLASLTTAAWLHIPMTDAVRTLAGVDAIRAFAPIRPAVLRHVLCGLTLPFRREFRQADLVYTRNLWIAWIALLFGQRVVFDHYRPWPEQIPPLQLWLYRLFCHRRMLVNVCHSEYTRSRYLNLGIPAEKLHRVHNGYEPRLVRERPALEDAKLRVGLAPGRRAVVYTGRVNRKKGLELVIAAAAKLPDVDFVLVGSYGRGPIEDLAKDAANVHIVPFQPQDEVANYIFAADALLIPPSWQPLAKFGSTVLPLKLFLYMASGRPILAGATPDVQEVLTHGDNALLCRPDCVESLVAEILTLLGDSGLAARLAARAMSDSRNFTWAARAETISAIVAARLRSAPTGNGGWGRAQNRAWIRQSARWLVHFLRERSFVLPPRAAAPAVRLLAAGQR